jgi:hypothetical protein
MRGLLPVLPRLSQAGYLDDRGQAPYTSATPEMDVIFDPLPGFGLFAF